MGKTFCFPILMALSLAWLSFAKFMDHVPSSNDFGIGFSILDLLLSLQHVWSIDLPWNFRSDQFFRDLPSIFGFPIVSIDFQSFPGFSRKFSNFSLDFPWISIPFPQLSPVRCEALRRSPASPWRRAGSPATARSRSGSRPSASTRGDDVGKRLLGIKLVFFF